METKTDQPLKTGCQLMTNMACGREPAGWYLRRRSRNLLRKVLRRLGLQLIHRPYDPPDDSAAAPGPTEINTGDMVRVRPLEEIRQTLDANGACKGCAFLEPMAQYCGRTLRVAKRVDRFFDEREWKMLKCRNVVLLEGVHCDGSGHPDTRGCQRMCFFFWRTEWLERID